MPRKLKRNVSQVSVELEIPEDFDAYQPIVLNRAFRSHEEENEEIYVVSDEEQSVESDDLIDVESDENLKSCKSAIVFNLCDFKC